MSAIKARGISKSFGNRCVLKAIDLEVEEGDLFAIIGPSGAGKTTLLRILCSLQPPDSGTVTILGKQMSYREAEDLPLRRRMSFISQKPIAFRETVRENVAYPLRVRGIENGNEMVYHALQHVGLLDLADNLGVTLSGGELQRMAFARATVYNPEVLILDEFTAHLDPYNIKMLEDAVVSYRKEKGATVLTVTHNLFQAKRIASTTAFMLDGVIVEQNETARIFNSPADERTGSFVRGEMIF
ncbi:MAG: ATP-binding cassette domain-containing protein [Candidatus Thermoplasmatota archaeon]|nr:ATP-binding cassette domain-containing protein [Euryarchaeota archaeon]MBU4032444.1 ATP-binding cassette domain-containing protein [Candidatus Thermoplasmatota archaeon]MBU4144476.1 ATP-binding cassette domain-containing protein [Candidatus Thermoplasmatota archaeon]MBU4592292.1 ATP-binding cassette domain-containing protein [Candidatus Thermoplasmatota archaeon]